MSGQMGTEDLISKYQVAGEEEDTITFMGSMKEKGVSNCCRLFSWKNLSPERDT